MRRHAVFLIVLAACVLAAASVAATCAPARSAGIVHSGTRPQAQNEPLSVVTMPLEPFVIEDGDRFTGFSVDLWDAVARQLGVEYRWVKVGSVDELLAAVKDGRADVGIAGISMTSEREQVVDFTMPFFNAGLRIMTSTHTTPTIPTLIGLIFSPILLKVLGLGLLVLIVMAHIIWLVERGGEEIPRAYLPGIWKSLWWSLATVATHEYGVLGESRAFFKRLLAMAVVVISVILIAQFTASVAASLTVHQLTGSIHSSSDLPGKRIATVRGTTGADYLAEQHLTAVEVDRIDDAYPLLQNGQAQAIVFDAPVLLYHAATKGKGVVQVVGPTLKDEYYGIALPAGSALRKPINEALLELMQDGSYTEIHDKWFGEN
jgi:polar amino acid transport system substrate-binding protein